VAWKLSNTMDTDFCVAALEEALGRRRPEIFNTDQGAQFTRVALAQTLQEQGIGVSNIRRLSTNFFAGRQIG
jgi:putative transposase